MEREEKGNDQKDTGKEWKGNKKMLEIEKSRGGVEKKRTFTKGPS